MIQTALILVLFSTFAGEDSQVSHQLKKKYLALWDSQRQEIVSGRVEFKWFRGGTNPRNVDAENVREIFREWSQLSADYDLEELVGKLFQINNPGEKRIKIGRLWFEGQRFREELGDDPVELIRVFDGEQEISVTPANNQVLIHNVGASRIGGWTLEHFRHIPRIAPDSNWHLAPTPGNLVRMTNISDQKGKISSRGAFVDFHSDNGIVVYLEGRVNEQVRYQYFQGLVQEYAVGVKMPRWSAKVQFATNGRFKNIQVACLKDAAFNLPVPSEQFKFATPSGYRVIDHRTQPPRSIVESPKSDDVIELLSKDVKLAASGQSPAWSILAICACLICAIAVLVARRRQQGR